MEDRFRDMEKIKLVGLVGFKERESVKRVSQVFGLNVGWRVLLLTKIWDIGERTVKTVMSWAVLNAPFLTCYF